jgi:hypothetical protein
MEWLVELLTVVVAGAVPLAAWRMWLNRPAARAALLHPAPQGDARLDARLERIEQAMDAMATEVERIAEGQRFTTKLMAEMRPASLPRAPERSRLEAGPDA